MANEEFEKINDQTLRVKTSLGSNSSWARSLTKLFNFEAQQVTSIYSEWIVSSGPSITSQMSVQNFADIQSQAEIERMRDKLVELKGKPNAIENGLPKKSLRQATP